jgi:hypothetical protein
MKTHGGRFGIWLTIAGVALTVGVETAPAQDTDEALFEGVPRENAVVDRDLALRLRFEAQVTDDSDELIDTDIAYARYPSRMYSGEAKLFDSSRATISTTYALWENDQDMEGRSWGWRVRWPMFTERQTVYDSNVSSSFLSLQYRFQEDPESSENDLHNYYAGVDRSFENGIYAYLQYRYTSQGGESTSHQLYEYLSWKPWDGSRIGQVAAATRQDGAGDSFTPWYVRLFAACFLVDDWTSLRLEARHYQSTDDLSYQEYKAFLYQKLTPRGWIRFSYRHYMDSEEISSDAWGIKYKFVLSPRASAHIGYRYYDQSEGLDFDTYVAGISLLL